MNREVPGVIIQTHVDEAGDWGAHTVRKTHLLGPSLSVRGQAWLALNDLILADHS